MRCKIGDLAMIVHDPLYLVDIGKFVLVHKLARKNAPYGPEWKCKPLGGGLTGTSGNRKCLCEIPDAWLRPLNPLSESESQETTKELEHG